ncbi:MAG: preprotein translocase subunit YajC [Treponema sp.]|nr:preprotein translocase subunit YajC [Treponema sp.]
MYTFFLPLLQAEGAPAPGLDFGFFVPLIAIGLIFYFLIIRPQNKKRKETEKMHSGLRKGDKIVTIGGLYGTIQSVKDTTVIIKADDNVKLEFLRSAISSVITQSSSKDDDEKNTNVESSNEDSENK